MNFEGCSAPLVIRGNGARLRCAAGLRYGSFDPLGRAIRGRASGGASGELATPYHAMVRVARCNALIEIADLPVSVKRQLRKSYPRPPVMLQPWRPL